MEGRGKRGERKGKRIRECRERGGQWKG